MKRILTVILLSTSVVFFPFSLVRAESTVGELPKWDIQVHGGFLMRHQYSAPVAAEIVGLTGPGVPLGQKRIEASDNYTGGLNVRRRLNENIDIGLGYSGIASAGNDRNFSGSPAAPLFLPGAITTPFLAPVGSLNIVANTTATHHIADLDLGYLVNLGAVSSLKIIGGIRFIRFDQNTNLTSVNVVSPFPSSFSNRREDSFVGAGPRLGAQFFHDLGNDFSLKIGVNGSVLGGHQRVETTTRSSLAIRELNQSHGRVVYNTGAELSLARNWTESLSTSIGYQASAWFGLRDNWREIDAAATIATGTFFVAGGERRPIDVYHGPFLSVRYHH